MIDDSRPTSDQTPEEWLDETVEKIALELKELGFATMFFDSYMAQREKTQMFNLLAKHGPMEVSPGGEMRKLEE